MTVYVISPHYDDAVLSAAQWMTPPGGRGRVVVVTVCAGVPVPGVLGDYDRACGWVDSATAMVARDAEDIAACAVLGVDRRTFDVLDAQYRSGALPLGEVAGRVRRLLRDPADCLVYPYGIDHPDHVAVSAACEIAASAWDGEVVIYEELPYRVRTPVSPLPWSLETGTGPLDVKVRAVSCYASQIDDEVARCAFVPERLWRIR